MLFIHQMNRVKSRNDLSHDDSIVVVIIIIIILFYFTLGIKDPEGFGKKLEENVSE